MVLLTQVVGKVFIPGKTPETTILHVLQVMVFRFCVYAVLFDHKFPSPKSAVIIAPVAGLPAQNVSSRKLLLSHTANTLMQTNTISGIIKRSKNDFLIFIS